MTSGTPMLTRDADLHYPVLIMQGFQKKQHQWNKAMQCQDHHTLAISRSWENDQIKICTMKF